MTDQERFDLETYYEGIELQEIAAEAARAAREENRRHGLANVYSHNGKVFYELPNGELTLTDPFTAAPSGS